MSLTNLSALRSPRASADRSNVAGWLAGQVMRGAGFGLIGNIVVGMVGALVAGWLLPGFWPITGILGAIIHSAIGAATIEP